MTVRVQIDPLEELLLAMCVVDLVRGFRSVDAARCWAKAEAARIRRAVEVRVAG